MIIIYLHSDPVLCAQQYCDKHLTQALLETGQMLSTALHRVRYKDPSLYKSTFENHPSARWLRVSLSNFTWTYSLFEAMADEFRHRFEKEHKSWIRLGNAIGIALRSGMYKDLGEVDNPWGGTSFGVSYTWDKIPFYPPPQVVTNKYMVKRSFGIMENGRDPSEGMLDLKYEYQSLTTIMAFRRYYLNEKAASAVWTKRSPPDWFVSRDLNDLMDAIRDLEFQSGIVNPVARNGRINILPNGEPIYNKNNLPIVKRFFKRTTTQSVRGNHSQSSPINVPNPVEIRLATPRMEQIHDHQQDAFRIQTTLNWGIPVVNPATVMNIGTV